MLDPVAEVVDVGAAVAGLREQVAEAHFAVVTERLDVERHHAHVQRRALGWAQPGVGVLAERVGVVVAAVAEDRAEHLVVELRQRHGRRHAKGP